MSSDKKNQGVKILRENVEKKEIQKKGESKGVKEEFIQKREDFRKAVGADVEPDRIKEITEMGKERAGAVREKQSDRGRVSALHAVREGSNMVALEATSLPSKSIFHDFVNKYPVTKTLRFSLKPIGKTEENIKEKGLLKEDKDRAIKYKQAKRIIDEYHKNHINERLKDFHFELKDLEEFAEAYKQLKKFNKSKNKDSKLKDKLSTELSKIQGKLRKDISEHLLKGKTLKQSELFKADLITDLIPKLLEKHILHENEESNSCSFCHRMKEDLPGKGVGGAQKIINSFKKWTTYFGGFHENRKNIYTDKGQPTAISYRVVHENLPRFLNNMEGYKKATKEFTVDFSKVTSNFKMTLDKMDLKSLDELFTLDGFNQCLTQEGIDGYNLIRGGQSKGKNGETKQKGINETINDYEHKFKSENREKKAKELHDKCLLLKLHKQILNDRGQNSFLHDTIENDADLYRRINSFFPIDLDGDGKIIGSKERGRGNEEIENGELSITDFNITEKLEKVLNSLSNANLDKVYIKNDECLTEISKYRFFGNRGIIKQSLEYYAEKGLSLTLNERKKWIKRSYYSISDIHKALECYYGQYTDEELKVEKNLEKEKEIAFDKPLLDYFKKYNVKIESDGSNENEWKDILEEIKKTFKKAFSVLEKYKGEVETLKNEKDDVHEVKKYLDTLKLFQGFLKPLEIPDTYNKDMGFYTKFEELYEIAERIIPLYNQVRNYLTKKPYNVEKYRLNFKHMRLLVGFGDSHTEKSDNGTQYGGYLFRKKLKSFDEYEYFLGISQDSKLFRCHLKDEIKIEDQSNYERLCYHQSKGHFFPKNTYPENKEKIIKFLLEKVKASKILEDEDRGKILSMKNITPKSLMEEISKFKEPKHILQDETLDKILLETVKNIKEHIGSYIEKYPDLKSIKNKDYLGYESFIEIIKALSDIDKKGREIHTFSVSQRELDVAVERDKKPLYLFRISNKDLDFYRKKNKDLRKKRGRDNLHTMYFKQLFSKNSNRVFDLGSGEVFFRKKTEIKNNTVHIKGKPIVCKTYEELDQKTGKKYYRTVPFEVYKELTEFYLKKRAENELSEDSLKLKDKVKVNTFKYDILKDKRYTQDSFSLHLSVECNFQKEKIKNKKFNEDVNETLIKPSRDIKIIGIDRGERHLAYYTVIDQEGNISEQGSLNNPARKKDYHDLLNKREKERDRARKSWKTIGKIKDIKEGYLSQVVHKIAKLMKDHNAIVVLEDLNSGFKRSRLKFEKQVYQKLEKALIDKLNYLVFKDLEINAIGGVNKALQLTAKIDSFKELNKQKQTGFLFYVPAYYTSKVCPATGFVDLFGAQYKSVKDSKSFFNEFKKISFNKNEGCFEFHFNYKKFCGRAKTAPSLDWIICSHGERIDRGKAGVRMVNLTEDVEKLFKDYRIDYQDEKCLKGKVLEQNDPHFFEKFMKLFKLTLQIRNSIAGTNQDWLTSSVKDKDGNFFDSNKLKEDESGNFFDPKTGIYRPANADANGAYHIALKGLLVIEKMKKGERSPHFISNEEWFRFLLNRAKKAKLGKAS